MGFDYTNLPCGKERIIQNSFNGTGSTVVTNLLFGLLCPSCPYFISDTNRQDLDRLISKSHNMDYLAWRGKFGDRYDLYFVSTERDKKIIKPNGFNILVIPYEKILETEDYSLHLIVDYFYDMCRNFLPEKFFIKNELDIKRDMFKRVDDMNKLYEEIKHRPFHKCHNKFFGIHGNHRGRKTKGYYSKYKN